MTILVWLAPLLYPVSLKALFSSAQWAQSQVVGVPFVALALMWACVGPLLAICALNHLSFDRGAQASTRVLVVGAVMAAISPSLFLFVSRANDGLSVNLGMFELKANALSLQLNKAVTSQSANIWVTHSGEWAMKPINTIERSAARTD